jgi:hypothetical protein
MPHDSNPFSAQMAESRNGVVVTEEMLTEAVRARDPESLTIWARQGVRVTTAEPLFVAVRGGHLEVMQCLVRELGADVDQKHVGDWRCVTPLIVAASAGHLAALRCLVELGADINKGDRFGATPLIMAASTDHPALVRCLVDLGAEVGKVDNFGDTAFLASARDRHYSTMRYLLEEAGASMEDVNKGGHKVWSLLILHLENVARGYEVETDPLALPGLLRVLVLRGAPLPALVALLSPEPARLVQEGAQLRARLPAYIAHRRTYLDLRCPRISV